MTIPVEANFVSCTVCAYFELLVVVLMVAPVLGQVELAGVTWEERMEVVSGEAYRGPWRMNRSDFRYVDDPTVAFTEEENPGVAWVDQSRQDIFFQIYESSGKARFDEPINVSGSGDIFSWLPRMVVPAGDPDHVYVLWQEIVFSGGTHGGEIFFARSTDGGRNFSDPINLSTTRAGAGKGRLAPDYWHNGSLDIAVGPGGTIHAAWTEFEGKLRVSRSTDGGESFSTPVHVAGGGDGLPARGPSLAVADEETVYLAWTVGEDRSANIHFATSEDGGRSFDRPQIVSESEGHSDAPKIAADDEGTVHLVYGDSPQGPLRQYHICYIRLKKGEPTSEEPKIISKPSPEEFDGANFPALQLDGANNLYVLWELFAGPGDRSKGLGFTRSSNGGETFASPSIVPGSADASLGLNGSQQGLLMEKLAVGDSGVIAVVNSTFTRNESSHIWLHRGRTVKR